MSGWEGFFEEDAPLPPSLPDRPLKLPEANKMARSLRTGRTVSDLAVRYGVAVRVITRRLTDAGWDPATGKWAGAKPTKDTPLSMRGGGPGTALHYVGGGDNPNVVPLVARPIRERPKSTGFPWPQREESAQSAPVVPRLRPHPRRSASTRRRSSPNEARRKLTLAMREEIARRYEKNLESSVTLAAEFGVNQRTIRKALAEEGVHIRSRSEAGYLRWAANHPQQAQRAEPDGAA